MLDRFVRVAAVGDVPEGGMIDVVADDVEICLALVEGRYYAVGNVCTHFYTWLSLGELHPQALAVQCPMHESRFSLLTGEALEPPAEEPVPLFAVRLENGDILVGPQHT